MVTSRAVSNELIVNVKSRAYEGSTAPVRLLALPSFALLPAPLDLALCAVSSAQGLVAISLTSSADNVINTQQQCRALNRRLERLNLDASAFKQTVGLHVGDLTSLTINTVQVLPSCVLCAKLGQSTDDVATTVLDERPGDDLEGVGDSLVRRALDTFESLGFLCESHRDSHLCGATTWGQRRVEDDISGDGHGIGQVTVNLVEDVLGRTTKKDGASLGVTAFCEE